MSMLKRNVSMALFIFSMLYIIFSYFTGIGEAFAADLEGFGVSITTFAILIGVIELFKRNVGHIVKKAKNWPYSFVTLASFLIYAIVLFTSPEGGMWMTDVFYTPLSMVIFLMGVTQIQQLWHGARARSWYAVLLLFSIAVSGLYLSTIGSLISPSIPVIGTWLKDVPVAGVSRAFMILTGLGLLILALRTLLGYEKSYMGEAGR